MQIVTSNRKRSIFAYKLKRMAKPVIFPESNFTLLGGETGALDLHCYRDPEQGRFISCWELSAEELAEVAKTGRVFISVYSGCTAPPVWVGGNPFITPEEIAENYFMVKVLRESDRREVDALVPNRLREAYFKAVIETAFNRLTEDELKNFIFIHS